jgi:hypothetical protein
MIISWVTQGDEKKCARLKEGERNQAKLIEEKKERARLQLEDEDRLTEVLKMLHAVPLHLPMLLLLLFLLISKGEKGRAKMVNMCLGERIHERKLDVRKQGERIDELVSWQLWGSMLHELEHIISFPIIQIGTNPEN